MRTLLLLFVGVPLVASLTGCSSLTRPDEITIQAEPLGAPPPPPPAPAPAPAAAPAAGAQSAG